jgi:hypothetical protein
MNNQPEVHQASGMLRVQLGIPIADALALLRARAYVDDRPVAEVAHEVLTGALQLDEAEPE